MENIVGGLMGIVIGLVIGITILIVLGFVLKWLWNTTMPEISAVREIITVHAIKLLFIAAILFGGHRVITVPEDSPTAAPVVQSSSAQSELARGAPPSRRSTN